MTSIKVIRERESETANALEQHALLSASYSALQQHFPELGFSVTEITVNERHSSMTAVRQAATAESPDILVVVVCGEECGKEEFTDLITSAKSSYEKPESKVSIAVASVSRSSGKNQDFSSEAADSVDFLFLVNKSSSELEVTEAKNAPFSLFRNRDHENVLRVMDNFPHPYSRRLDPFIKFTFVSMNGSRYGKESLADVLNESAEYAYALTVGVDREAIRSDLHEVLREMDKAGVITARGNEIYFPRNTGKLRHNFIRKYWDYLEKIGKKTLFDFDSHF